jgi:hypothetical protein
MENMMSEWQPIDTAPLAGTMVDLWVVAVPRYNAYFEKYFTDGDDQRLTDCIFEDDQWKHWTEIGDHEYDPHHEPIGDCFKPTHWMPLPEPPQ